MKTFTNTVRLVVRNIPKGSMMTYKEVSIAAGNPKAARAVAIVMSKNFDESIPCHRVICSSGKIGGYNRGGEVVKKSLLQAEGAV